MTILLVPVYLYVLPFLLLFVLLKCVNWLIKKGNAQRPLALILSLTIGGLWIFGGVLFLTRFGIILFSVTVIFTGGLFVLIGGYRSLFVRKQKIIDGEIQDKIAEEKSKIEDHPKFSRLIEVLDNNRSYPEFKRLSKELKALEQKEHEELSKRISRSMSRGY